MEINGNGNGNGRVGLVGGREDTLVRHETIRFLPRQREQFVGFSIAHVLGTFVGAERTHLSLVEGSQHFILDVVDHHV